MVRVSIHRHYNTIGEMVGIYSFVLESWRRYGQKTVFAAKGSVLYCYCSPTSCGDVGFGGVTLILMRITLCVSEGKLIYTDVPVATREPRSSKILSD